MLLASPLAVASSAWASSPPPTGGAAPTNSPVPSGSSGGALPVTVTPTASGSWGATPTNLLTSATGAGISVTTRGSAVFGHRLSFIGVALAAPGTVIAVQRYDPQAGWVTVATATTGVGGVFWAKWKVNLAGAITLQTVFEQSATATQTGPGAATLQVNVYRPAIATYYGPRFYGQRTACGRVLTPAMLGVANRTLKCGTRVQLYYHGATITVRVIDRGPYANDADWDLTQATAHALGISGTEVVGVMQV